MTINIPRWTTSKEEADKLVDELSEVCFEYGKDESSPKLFNVFYATKAIKNYVGIMQGRIELLNARIAELEAESERFTVHSDIERQDNKWIPEEQKMNDKFTEDFIKEQLNVMEKFEKADCSLSPEYIAGRNAAIKNYVDALRKISSLEHEIRSWCRDMSTICDDGKKRVIEAERKVANLHKVIAKQQIKIQRQAENIATLLQLYTSGKRSKSHKKLREKYRALKARVSIAGLEREQSRKNTVSQTFVYGKESEE